VYSAAELSMIPLIRECSISGISGIDESETVGLEGYSGMMETEEELPNLSSEYMTIFLCNMKNQKIKNSRS